MKGLARSISRGPRSRAPIVKQTIQFTGSVDITGVNASVDAGEIVIGDLPQGNILLLGAVAYVSVDAGADASVLDQWLGDYAIGTVPNSNDVDVGDSGEADIIGSTALAAGASDKLAPSTRGEMSSPGLIFDNTDGSLELNLNLLIDDNFITDTEVGTFVATGLLHLAYIVLGDD